jgi:hypothetical protein
VQGPIGPQGPAGNVSSGGTVGGTLLFTPDNTYDIGANGANRPRNLYAGGSIYTNSDVYGGAHLQTSDALEFYGAVGVVRPTNNIVEQRNTTSALYSEAAGTGSIRSMNIGTLGGGSVTFLTGGANRWQITGPGGGHLWAATDNTYDIGAAGANRPRNVFAASGIYTAMNTAAQGPAIYGGSGVPAAGLGANGDVFHRSDTPATSLQRIYVKSAGAWLGIV